MSCFPLHEQCVCPFCVHISRLVFWFVCLVFLSLSISNFPLTTTFQNKASKQASIGKNKEFQSSSISFSFNQADYLRYLFLPSMNSTKNEKRAAHFSTKEVHSVAARKGMPTYTINSALRCNCSTLVTLIYCLTRMWHVHTTLLLWPTPCL